MRKWTHLIAILFLGLSWLTSGSMWMAAKNARAHAQAGIGMSGDTEQDERLQKTLEEADRRIQSLTVTGFVLTLASCGYVGLWFVTTVLPAMAQRATDIAYGSGAKLEPDAMRDAHVHIAKGEYVDAIEDFIRAVQEDPMNLQAWWEIGKIQMGKLHEPEAAVSNYRKALKQPGWEPDDEAFLHFRLSEAHHACNAMEDAAHCMHEVIKKFPETRHAANARHQLHEWGLA